MELKNQHYLPQFYLKKFKIEKKMHPSEGPPIFVCDKVSNTIKRKAISKVGKENYFYSIINYDDSKNQLIEKNLSKIEAMFSNILNKIELSFKDRNFSYKFSEDEKSIITFFILWQIKRTPEMKEVIKNIILKTINKNDDCNSHVDMKSLNNSVLFAMTKAGEAIGLHKYILNRKWNLIYIINDNINLITSDKPINYKNLDDPNEELSFILTKKIILILQGIGDDECFKLKSFNQIKDINKIVFDNASKYVFSDDESELKEISEAVK